MNNNVFKMFGEIDHIYPLSKGGSNSNNNLCVISRNANRRKRDKIIM